MALDLSSFYQTINVGAIAEYEAGLYIPLEAHMIEDGFGKGTVNVPKFVNRTAVNAADETELSILSNTEENITITPDAPLKAHEYIGYDKINRVGNSYMSGLSSKLGRGLATGHADRRAALLAATAMTGSNTVEVDGESTDADYWARRLELLLATLDNATSNSGGPTWVLSDNVAHRYYRQAMIYGSSDYSDTFKTSHGADADMFKVGNVTFIGSNSVIFTGDTSSDTNYATKYRRDFASDRIRSLVWRPDAMTVAVFEDMNVKMNEIHDKDAWLIESRSHFGTAITQSDAVYVLQDDANTT